MRVAQPSAKEVLTALEHVFAAEGGLAESAVKYPLGEAGQYAALGHGLTEDVEAELLGRVQAAVALIPEFIRPPVPSTLGELRLELPQGATAMAAAGADDGAAAAAFAAAVKSNLLDTMTRAQTKAGLAPEDFHRVLSTPEGFAFTFHEPAVVDAEKSRIKWGKYVCTLCKTKPNSIESKSADGVVRHAGGETHLKAWVNIMGEGAPVLDETRAAISSTWTTGVKGGTGRVVRTVQHRHALDKKVQKVQRAAAVQAVRGIVGGVATPPATTAAPALAQMFGPITPQAAAAFGAALAQAE